MKSIKIKFRQAIEWCRLALPMLEEWYFTAREKAGKIDRGAIILSIASSIATLRLAGYHGEFFQAIAHLFMGFIGALAYLGARGHKSLFVVMSVIELVSFIGSMF